MDAIERDEALHSTGQAEGEFWGLLSSFKRRFGLSVEIPVPVGVKWLTAIKIPTTLSALTVLLDAPSELVMLRGGISLTLARTFSDIVLILRLSSARKAGYLYDFTLTCIVLNLPKLVQLFRRGGGIPFWKTNVPQVSHNLSDKYPA